MSQAYGAAEAEVETRLDDVMESHVNQIKVLCRRIDDVVSLRVDAVSDVSTVTISPLCLVLCV